MRSLIRTLVTPVLVGLALGACSGMNVQKDKIREYVKYNGDLSPTKCTETETLAECKSFLPYGSRAVMEIVTKNGGAAGSRFGDYIHWSSHDEMSFEFRMLYDVTENILHTKEKAKGLLDYTDLELNKVGRFIDENPINGNYDGVIAPWEIRAAKILLKK